MKRDIILLFLSFTTMMGLRYYSTDYTINDTYAITFNTKKVEGSFQGLTGEVIFDAQDLENATMNVSVEVSSIQTGNEKKDGHSKGKKWFHAEKYPQISFVSKSIKQENGEFIVLGDLTIKDVTKNQTIHFTSDIELGTTYLNGTMTVNRKDYNIKGNLLGFTVGKNVDISLHVPANFKQ